MSQNTSSTLDTLANVPHPAGATYVAEWDDDGSRYYYCGTRRVVDRADDRSAGRPHP